MIARIGADGIDGLGVRLISTMLGIWESPAGSGIAVALRWRWPEPDRARMLRGFVGPRLVGVLLRPLDIPADEIELRTGLLMSQVLGLITGRYLLAVEPLASLPAAELAATVGATVQRYLTGPLTELER